jgi:hypothetical protein
VHWLLLLLLLLLFVLLAHLLHEHTCVCVCVCGAVHHTRTAWCSAGAHPHAPGHTPAPLRARRTPLTQVLGFNNAPDAQQRCVLLQRMLAAAAFGVGGETPAAHAQPLLRRVVS